MLGNKFGHRTFENFKFDLKYKCEHLDHYMGNCGVQG